MPKATKSAAGAEASAIKRSALRKRNVAGIAWRKKPPKGIMAKPQAIIESAAARPIKPFCQPTQSAKPVNITRHRIENFVCAMPRNALASSREQNDVTTTPMAEA